MGEYKEHLLIIEIKNKFTNQEHITYFKSLIRLVSENKEHLLNIGIKISSQIKNILLICHYIIPFKLFHSH